MTTSRLALEKICLARAKWRLRAEEQAAPARHLAEFTLSKEHGNDRPFRSQYSTGWTTDPSIQGEFTGVVAILDRPRLGKSNLVINGTQPFDITVNWHLFGNLVPMWLTALSVRSPNWVVTAYAEAQGPGPEITLGSVNVP